MQNQALETDEYREAVEGLVMTVDQLLHTRENPYRWKWVIVTLHSTLQGFMVLALADSAGVNALSAKSRAEWLKWYNADMVGDPPRERQADFLDLFGRIQDKDAMRVGMAKNAFEADDDVKKSVTWLNVVRNEFMHFGQKSWLIHLGGTAGKIRDCLKPIRFLVEESGGIRFYDAQQKRYVLALLSVAETLATEATGVR